VFQRREIDANDPIVKADRAGLSFGIEEAPADVTDSSRFC
jgi:hypothetical protein